MLAKVFHFDGLEGPQPGVERERVHLRTLLRDVVEKARGEVKPSSWRSNGCRSIGCRNSGTSTGFLRDAYIAAEQLKEKRTVTLF